MYIFHLGNNCSHNVLEPKLPSQKKKSKISILQKAKDNCEKFYFDYTKSNFLESLISTRQSDRKIRSEGRERTIAVLQVILQQCELSSLKVGVPNEDGTFWSPSLKWIAEKAGFRQKGDAPEKGIKRAWRALNDLVNAGYLEINQRYKTYGEDQMQYKGLPAIKQISEKLFIELGIDRVWLKKSRMAATKRLRATFQAFTNKISLGKVQKAIGLMSAKKDKDYKKRKKQQKKIEIQSKLQKTNAIEREKQLIQHALQLSKEQGRNPTEVILELRQKLSS